jgi:hypothetical protein
MEKNTQNQYPKKKETLFMDNHPKTVEINFLIPYQIKGQIKQQ